MKKDLSQRARALESQCLDELSKLINNERVPFCGKGMPHLQELVEIAIEMDSDEFMWKVRNILKIYHVFNRNLLANQIKAIYDRYKGNRGSIEWFFELFETILFGEIMSGGQKGNGQWNYIPYNNYTLHSCQNFKYFIKNGKKIIDIGCGPGTKVKLFSLMNPKIEAFGIEYDFVNVQIGGARLGRSIMHKDAFEYSEYGKFDRIYTWQPIAKMDLLEKFYLHVWDQLSKKTMWYEVYLDTLINILRKNKRKFDFPKDKKGRQYKLIVVKP